MHQYRISYTYFDSHEGETVESNVIIDAEDIDEACKLLEQDETITIISYKELC